MRYTSLKVCAITIGDEDGWWLTFEILGSTEKGRKNGCSMPSVCAIFLANGIEDKKKKDVFLTVIKPQTYKLLTSLVAPAKPGEKDYTQLV